MLGSPLTEADLFFLRRSWLTDEWIALAGIRRFDETTAREVLGINSGRSGSYAGLGFSYRRPGDPTINEWNVRRDKPDFEPQPDGSMKERAKYLGPPGRGNRFYFVPQTPEVGLTDVELPVVFVEGEKKALALARLAEHESEQPRWLPIGLAGVWSWRGTIGKAAGPDGDRRDVKGPLADFDLLLWQDREVIIVFDNDTHTNPKVRAAREKLARELRGRGAKVRLVDLPTSTEKIGIDDFLVSSGPDEALRLINNARLADVAEINASDGDLARVSKLAWTALLERNEPPYLFRFGGRLVRLEHDEESKLIAAVLTEYGLRHELASAARWLRPPRKSGDNPAPTKPPLDVVRDMLATPEPPLPVLRGIATAPQLSADGTITPPGYDAESGIYFAVDGHEIIRLDHEPTQPEIEDARRLIVEEMLGDFPFASDADRAHAVALLVLPFVRGLIQAPTPLHLIEKPSPGTGGTLLSEVLSLPAVGSPIGSMVEGRDDDEWRKRITAKLRSGAIFIVIDNVRRPLSSSALASAITATVWEDRLLGSSDQVRLPIRCCWVANGNNPALSNEMARRTVRIRLDAKQDRPWLRLEFRHPILGEWVTQNRNRIRRAVLVLAKAWYCAGSPTPSATVRLGMFEDWCRVIGGILDVAGIDGFLANLDQFYADSDSEGEAVRALLRLWWDEFGSRAVGVSSLFPLAEQAGIDLGDKGERSEKTRLGKRLRQLRDTRYTLSEGLTLRLVKAGTVHGSAAVKLVQV